MYHVVLLYTVYTEEECLLPLSERVEDLLCGVAVALQLHAAGQLTPLRLGAGQLLSDPLAPQHLTCHIFYSLEFFILRVNFRRFFEQSKVGISFLNP